MSDCKKQLAPDSTNTRLEAENDEARIRMPAMSRRTLIAGGAAIGANLLLGTIANANDPIRTNGASVKAYDIATNGISLHVTEQGHGPAVLFCHGFPDTSFTWRRQMQAVASAGYRAIAPDMRGYGRSSAPPAFDLYTPLQTVGDLVGLLDALSISSAVLVGHDWGATHAWNAALMRPDRFKAVFCLSVPYVPRGDVSVFDRMRRAGHQDDFYMFEQIRPEADQIWADSGAGTVTFMGGSGLRGTQHCGVQAHRLSRRTELLSRRGALLQLVLSVERSKDRAALVFYYRESRRVERTVSAYGGTTPRGRARPCRQPRTRQYRALGPARSF